MRDWQRLKEWEIMEEGRNQVDKRGFYCPRCRTFVEPQGEICPNCNQNVASRRTGKNKTLAIILNAIFGCFGWIYTFKVDAWRILICLLPMLLIDPRFFIVGWFWAVLQAIFRSTEFYQEYQNPLDASPAKFLINLVTAFLLVITFITVLANVILYLMHLLLS